MTIPKQCVVVVESPSKAKTIEKYLGPGHTVLASYGHIRDLPSKNGSVDPEQDYAMHWQMPEESLPHVNKIADALRKADVLILATDPDREGEAISWHIADVLRERGALADKTVQRVTFTEITPQAVRAAMSAPREIDERMVQAYLARRALDYLVGFTLSPVLWRKLPGSRSAGRVQSVALRMITERELEIEQFIPEEYWSVAVTARNMAGETFAAVPNAFNGAPLRRKDLGNAAAAHAVAQAVRDGSFTVSALEAKPHRRRPSPPFITSTLQQEAARKFGFGAQRTMQIAQKLYEGISIGGETVGLITYMRTDGYNMSAGAISDMRALIESRFGKKYLPEAPQLYKSKAKNAQEAHEAIRPTDVRRLPGTLSLSDDQAKLYELIWKRTMACQMEAAVFERTGVDLSSADGQVQLRANGSVQLFDGFLCLYQESRDDEADDDASRLPAMRVGEAIGIDAVLPAQHFTEPPPRYTEASLVKRMEELGIGRPSTYASTMSVLRERDYVRVEKNRLFPEDKGRIVTHFLRAYFAKYIEYDFTADLESRLDHVSDGTLKRSTLLDDFWHGFKADVDATAELRISHVIDRLNDELGHRLFPPQADGTDLRKCPACAPGQLMLKLSKFGAFIGCNGYPECSYTRSLSGEFDAAAVAGPRVLGNDASGDEVTLRVGRFGPYVQVGTGKTIKRAGVPKALASDALSLDDALGLLSLPKALGAHPVSGLNITVGSGRFGPYVQHGETYYKLKHVREAFALDLSAAIVLIDTQPPKPESKSRRKPPSAAAAGKAKAKPKAAAKAKKPAASAVAKKPAASRSRKTPPSN